jgi:hypothetical protein
MSLIKELHISWKDFLSEARPAGRMIMSDRRGPVAIVDRSVYNIKQQNYAAVHRIPLGAVVE